MPSKRPLTYEDAGVSFREASRAKSRIKTLAQRTFDKNVLTGIGSFGAAYALYGQSLRQPILISSADGVGTKLKVAFATGVHNTVGQDLVNHCVNDIAVQGARPLFFLDYLAAGKLNAAVTAQVVEGLSRACKQNACALIGGETAEMPGMYQPGEYDLAGFIVGVAERGKMLDGKKIRAGHTLIGLPSTGLHTNGYSLARKLLFEVAGYKPKTAPAKLRASVGSELLKVHRSYLKAIQALLAEKLLDGAAHITGGGITDNTPRMLPPGLRARIRYGAWPVLPVFDLLREIGSVSLPDMLQTFNMGIGMILAVPARSEAKTLAVLKKNRERAYVIGRVEKGRGGVVYE